MIIEYVNILVGLCNGYDGNAVIQQTDAFSVGCLRFSAKYILNSCHNCSFALEGGTYPYDSTCPVLLLHEAPPA